MKSAIGLPSSTSIIKEFVKKAIAAKRFYIACAILLVIAAFLVNKYSHTVYESNATILLAKSNRPALLNSAELFRGIEFLQDNKNMENEVNMVQTFALVAKCISDLNYEVGYFLEKQGIINQVTEIYQESPFTVIIDKSHLQPIDVNFYVQILNDSSYRLSASQTDVAMYNFIDNEVESKKPALYCNSIYKFNQVVSTNDFRFTINLNKKNYAESPQKVKYYFQLYHLDYLAMQYLKSMKAEPVSPLASIISIRLRGENLHKITMFLNKYLNLYLSVNLEKKNKASISTVQFIDSQIAQISDSLVSAESKLRDYRSANQIMDLSFQGQRVFDQMSQIQTELANLQVQKRYYNYILDYFNKNKDFASVVPPSSMNIVDPIMNRLVTDLISLSADRAAIVNTNSQKNLFLSQIEGKMKLQKEAILENVRNNLNTLNLSINELNYRSDKLNTEISQLPRTEIRMVGMERKFKLNDAIYTFLLQKRAEAEIARASNMPDYEILSPARNITTTVISPMRRINYLIALFFALFIPSASILIRDFFNDKLSSVFEIENYSRHKVIGVIYKNKHKNEAVIIEHPRSSIAESFRGIRTNLFIKLNSDLSRIILVSSSMPKEGKSFISFNLAASIASMGFKTLIIDCDLRQATMHKKFNVENNLGLSTFLLNRATMEEIIRISPVSNLSYITAGPIVPNPAELINSNICDKLFTTLRSKFDYIIIDTPPLGAVADSYLLMKYATLSLIVVRQNITQKGIFLDVVHGLETNKLMNYEIIFNDVNYQKSNYGRYYKSYYDEQDDGKNGLRKITDKKVINSN